MANARISRGKISLTVKYAELAADDAMKEITENQIAWPIALASLCRKLMAAIINNVPDAPYVALIIGRRPIESKKRPRTSGPAKFPNASGSRYNDTRRLSTCRNCVSTSPYVKKIAL